MAAPTLLPRRPDSSIIRNWVDSIRPELIGVDLEQPVRRADGRLLRGTRGEHLSRLLAETLMGYMELLGDIADYGGNELAAARSVLDEAVIGRRRGAVRMATDGRVPDDMESIAEIRVRVHFAAHAARHRLSA